MLRDGRLFGRKASSFTLQWHLTNACELCCLHCYDRSSRQALGLADAERILDDFLGFCRARRVSGQFCLTGGNPFLYPHFLPVYRAAAASGCPISILGNPVPERWKVKKDGGEFDQFAGATITPRGVVRAIRGGLDFFAANKSKLTEAN